MPNVKIYIDEALMTAKPAQIEGLVVQVRETIVAGLGVPEAACHIVVLGVRSLAGQTPVNIELCLLQKPGRIRAMVEAFCAQLRDLAVRILEAPSAIRCTLAESETYIVIRPG